MAVIEDIIIDYVGETATVLPKFSYIVGRPLIVGSPVGGRTLFVVDMNADNGERTVVGAQLKDPPEYSYRPPVSVFKTKWFTRDAVEETIGKYIRDYDKETSFTSDYPHGTTEDLDLFSTYIGDNTVTLEDISIIHHKENAEIILSMEDVPEFGEKINWADEAAKYPREGYIRVRSRRDDHGESLITVGGEGEFDFI